MEIFSWVSIVRAAGVIESATPLTTVLSNALSFLLSIVGIVGIIGAVVSGIWYLTAGGDEGRMKVAKRAMIACVTGAVIALAALLIVRQVAVWFT